MAYKILTFRAGSIVAPFFIFLALYSYSIDLFTVINLFYLASILLPFFFFLIRSSNSRVLVPHFYYPLFLFLIWNFFGKDNLHDLFYSFLFISIGASSLITYNIINQSSNLKLARSAFYCILALFPSAVVALYQFFVINRSEYNVLGLFFSLKMNDFTSTRNTFGAICTLFAITTFSLCPVVSEKWRKYVVYLGILYLVCSIITLSLVSLLPAIYILLYQIPSFFQFASLFLSRGILRVRHFLLIITSASGLFVFSLSDNLFVSINMAYVRLGDLFSIVNNNPSLNNVTARVHLIERAINLINLETTSSFLFGFDPSLRSAHGIAIVDNLLFDILLDNGFLGLLFFTFFIILLVRFVYSFSATIPMYFYSLILLLIVSTLSSSIFLNPSFFGLFLVLVGLNEVFFRKKAYNVSP